jgi:hypothetical protein
MGDSMVSCAIWKKNHAQWVFQRLPKLHESDRRSVYVFFKLHEKPYYYLLTIYMKKFAVTCVSHIWELRKLRILKNKKLRNWKLRALSI